MNKKSIFTIIISLSVGIVMGISAIQFSPGYLGYKKAFRLSGMTQDEFEDMLTKQHNLLKKYNELLEEEGLFVAVLSFSLLKENQEKGNINYSQERLSKEVDDYYNNHIRDRTINSLTKNQKDFKDKYEKYKKSDLNKTDIEELQDGRDTPTFDY